MTNKMKEILFKGMKAAQENKDGAMNSNMTMKEKQNTFASWLSFYEIIEEMKLEEEYKEYLLNEANEEEIQAMREIAFS